ncbi:methyltransferase [Parashewanella spongiae]|uniref:Methyltransferase n=1 Tax=Parashewanella spongiae TaxID=342950 RepID=A0A3A6T837_9GAMM|nr:methyltransferase [Parashewanella spongiae]
MTAAVCITTQFASISTVTAAEQANAVPLKYDFQYRSDKEQARDKYRHPKETLSFFEVNPTDTVVEIWPGGGWYTQVLATALKNQGHYVAAHWPKDSKVNFFKVHRAKFDQKFTANVQRYGEFSVSNFEPPMNPNMAPEETADVVLTFRNVHNWMGKNLEADVFAAAYRALRPGGIFGVVEHRANAGTSRLEMIKSGYVTEEFVRQQAIKAGFTFVGSSEINANAKDTKDYPSGVWTLPPTLRLKSIDKDKYLAIGESDRMTLKFRKPL